MLEQALLREQVQELLDHQQRAMRGYSSLAAKVTDRAFRESVTQLRRDKLRHVHLTERLLEILD